MTEGKRCLDELAGFYDSLAPDYDVMTGFEKRFIHERPFFRLLIEKYGIRTALDAGCGTGFHSLLLSKLGVHVTAVDVSKAMLERVAQHAKELDVEVGIVHSSFQELPKHVKTGLESVFSMGNSLAHLLSKEELSNSLKAFASVLKPQGVLFTQTLNYDRIMAQRERIQSVKESEGAIFVRYYEYGKENIHFHILKLHHEDGAVAHKLLSIDLRPILQEEFLHLLCDAGFHDVKVYGGVSMEEFHPETSKDLVVLARKGTIPQR